MSLGTSFVRTTILLATLTALFLVAGFLIAGTAGMTIALAMAILLNFFSYWFSDKIVLAIYRAKPCNDKEINQIVENLAKKAGIPKPKVYIVQLNIPNAFATGRDPNHSALAITTGLRDRLNKDEIEAVMAHEMAHVKNRDILVSSMAATIAGAISYLAQLAWWGMFSRDERNNGTLLLLPLLLLAPLAATLIHLAISRGREFGADYTGALITKKPLALASALDKITDIVYESPSKGNSATAHMWIVNPFTADSFAALFSTHPPVNERIKKLKEMQI